MTLKKTLLGLAMVTGVVSAAPSTWAACVGGPAITGNYSFAIKGVWTGGEQEGLAGVLKSNGNCTFGGTAYGIYNGTSISAAPITGTYTVNAMQEGTLTLNISGQPNRIFDIDLADAKHIVLGLEIDGSAWASINATKQISTTFGPSSISGDYVVYDDISVPTAPPFSSNGKSTFNCDGVSGCSGIAFEYQLSGTLVQDAQTISYVVNADGSFTMTIYNSSGYPHYYGGAINSSGANLVAAYMGGYNGLGTTSLTTFYKQKAP